MKNRVCKLDFHTFGNSTLDTFAIGILNGIFSNLTIFVAPPIEKPEFTAIITDYDVKLSDYNTYGKTKKDAFIAARGKVMTALDTFVPYVNEIANGKASVISLAGFEPTSGSSTAAPQLDRIITLEMTPTNVPGRIIMSTPAIVGKGVAGYGLILVKGAPLSVENFSNGVLRYAGGEEQEIIMDLTKARKKIVDGLDSKVYYYAYMYVFNATGVSPLSVPQIVKCM